MRRELGMRSVTGVTDQAWTTVGEGHGAESSTNRPFTIEESQCIVETSVRLVEILGKCVFIFLTHVKGGFMWVGGRQRIVAGFGFAAVDIGTAVDIETLRSSGGAAAVPTEVVPRAAVLVCHRSNSGRKSVVRAEGAKSSRALRKSPMETNGAAFSQTPSHGRLGSSHVAQCGEAAEAGLVLHSRPGDSSAASIVPSAVMNSTVWTSGPLGEWLSETRNWPVK